MKNVMRLLFLFCILFIGNLVFCQVIPVIPYPNSVEIYKDFCHIKKVYIVYEDNDLYEIVMFLNDELQSLGLNPLTKKGGNPKKAIVLEIDHNLSHEEYCVEVNEKNIEITGGGNAGVFYGIQTLIQLIRGYSAIDGIRLPCMTIEDCPRYEWRGFMLDEARHFFGKKKVLQLLDLMSYYKLNRFHWHLSDEEGWRVEIKKYPLLTSVGGRGTWSEPDLDEPRFYTQEDIKEIVAYATARNIEIIPEIDMPGHATAANRAYPFLSGGGSEKHPDFTFNVGKEEVYQFLSNVLREVGDLFPSKYMHIGGDEVAFGIEGWNTDEHVQELMKSMGMTEVREAERYFVRRMSDTVNYLGKTLIGWDELLDLGMDNSRTVIYWWRHDRENNLKRSLEGGFETVLCPRRPLYFDFKQHDDHKWGRVWNGFCPIEDVYSFPDKRMSIWNLTDPEKKLIKGIQANLWTERVHVEKRLEFMIFPRLCALAESAWTLSENKNYKSFEKRMDDAYSLFDELNIYYFDHRNPQRHPEIDGCEKKEINIPMDFRD